ncbi:MAG: tetratricopeptide repeat protein [Polyangia bacterium]
MRCFLFPGRGAAWAAILFVFSLAGFPTARAHAGEPSEDDLIRQGVAKRRHQDDEAALELFTRAYAIRKSPRAAAQMGLAEIAIGRWPEAEGHLQEALAASSDTWVTKNTATLNEALAKVARHLGSLQVLGGPAGAEVVVEGAVRGTLPMEQPIRVRAGECRFDVRATGYEPITRTVEISVASLTRETVHLSQVARAAATPEPQPVSPAPAATPAVEASSSDTGPAPDSGRTLRIVGLSLGAAGVAFAGAGLAFGVLAHSQGQTDTQAMTFAPDNQSKGKQYQTLQYVGYGVGGALLVAGVITYIIGYQREDSEPAPATTALLPSIVPTAGGLVAGLVGSL